MFLQKTEAELHLMISLTYASINPLTYISDKNITYFLVETLFTSIAK